MAESSIGGHTNPKYNETIWRCIRVIVGIDCKTYKHVIKRRVWAHYTHARTYIQCITHLVHIYSCLNVSLFFPAILAVCFFWFVWIACSWYRNVQVKNVVFDRTIQNTHTEQHEQKNIFENYVILDEYLERERVSMFIYVVLCVLRAFFFSFSFFHWFLFTLNQWQNEAWTAKRSPRVRFFHSRTVGDWREKKSSTTGENFYVSIGDCTKRLIK